MGKVGKNFVLQKFEISLGSSTSPLLLAEYLCVLDLNAKYSIFNGMFFKDIEPLKHEPVVDLIKVMT